jgi:hypothetical protein
MEKKTTFGWRLIRYATYLRSISPLIAVMIFCSLDASAQSVIGNDASRAVNLIKRIVDVFTWIMLVGGVFAVGRGVYIGWRGGSGAMTPIAWGMGGIGFGFLVSWINAEVGGNSVALPDP